MRAEFRIKQKQVKEMVQPPRDPSNQGKVRKLEAEVFRRDKILD